MAMHRMTLHAVAAATLLGSAGCLERKETITITPAGAVTIELEYSGSPQDFDTPDAMPSERSGWRVQRLTKLNDKEEEEITLTSSRRTFEPGEELPRSFAAEGNPQAELYLSFPTTVRHERREDGVYLHFRRTYKPRPWAYVEFWQDQFKENVKHLEEKPLDEMTHEEKVEIIKAFAGVELFKRVELVSAALKQCDPDLQPDAWLRARRTMLKVGEETDWDEVVERIGNLAEEERDAEFERESQRLLDRAHRAFVDELKAAAGYDAGQIEQFQAAYERAKTYLSITESLGGHAFKIQVQMPGEVVAHNADKLDDDGLAVWEFDGKAFRDRPYELMITSRIPEGKSDQ